MNRLPLEPQINQDASFMYALKARLREIARLFNSTADQVDTNTTDIAGKVNRAGDTMTGPLNLVSPSTSATEAASDNSTRIATTAWVRSALGTIFTALGFAVSFGTTSYIKFPSILGGWIVQWGLSSGSTNASSAVGVAFPLAFPTSCRAALVGSSSIGSTLALPIATARGTTGFTSVWVTGSAGGNVGVGAGISIQCDWVAFGN